MLGNLQDAMLIYRRRKRGDGPLPKGWKKLGAGSFRTAYLSPDGVVYKIAYEYYIDDDIANENDEEYLTYRRIRANKSKHKGWRVARLKPYVFYDGNLRVTINAQEFIRGKHDEMPDETSPEWSRMQERIDTAFEAFGLVDAHEENYVVAHNGKRVIIDYAR